MSNTVPRVGLIAEDTSDIDVAANLIRLISGKDKIGIKSFIGKGCGKVRRKCNAWAEILAMSGYQVLILIHDLDSNSKSQLEQQIHLALKPCPVKTYLISIPVTEIEAWLLADSENLKRSMKLDKLPKIAKNTINIQDPKERISNIVLQCTKGRKDYLNTRHNKIISERISVSKIIEGNSSFIPFYNFVRNYI